MAKRLKAKDPESYVEDDRQKKRKERTALKECKTKYEQYNAKDRMRKRKIHSQLEVSTALNKSFSSKQSFRKARAKVVKGLPASPGKKRMVLQVCYQLSLLSQKVIFSILHESKLQ